MQKEDRVTSIQEGISKQSVKRLVHETIVDFPLEQSVKKKQMRYLHIVADEDHVSAQFQSKREI